MEQKKKAIVYHHIVYSDYVEPHTHIIRAHEELYRVSSRAKTDGHISIDIVGITFPDPRYSATREAGNRLWRDQYVFEYVLSGRGYIDCAGQHVAVGAGDLYFLNRLHAHHYYADPDDPFEKLWINISGRLVNTLVEHYGISAGVVVRHYDAEAIFRDILARVALLERDNHAATFAAITRHIFALIQVLAGPDTSEVDTADLAGRAARIRRHIDAQPNYDLTLDDLAAHFKLNPTYLAKLFRRVYGISPTRYITARRLDAARNMLSNASTPVGEIAAALGYSSGQYFASAFKAATGLTPGQYRRGEQITKE